MWLGLAQGDKGVSDAREADIARKSLGECEMGSCFRQLHDASERSLTLPHGIVDHMSAVQTHMQVRRDEAGLVLHDGGGHLAEQVQQLLGGSAFWDRKGIDNDDVRARVGGGEAWTCLLFVLV